MKIQTDTHLFQQSGIAVVHLLFEFLYGQDVGRHGPVVVDFRSDGRVVKKLIRIEISTSYH